MGRIRHGAAAALWVAALAGTASAADLTETEELRARLAPGGQLRIENAVGEIVVRATDGEDVVFRVRKTVEDAADEEEARRALRDITLDLEETAEGVVLRSGGPRWLSRDRRDTEVLIEADVPRRVDLRLEINVGRLEIDGVEGTLVGRADVGEIRVRDAAGSLDLRTRVGEIRAEFAEHDGEALSFDADVGDIDVTLPADLRARLEASADIGDVHCDFEVDADGERAWLGRSLAGRIHGGGAPLRAAVHIGQVRIRAGD